MKIILWGLSLSLGNFLLLSCGDTPYREQEVENSSLDIRKNYIRKIPGENETIPDEVIQKGEVLIAYSDCYTCHSREKRSKGPSFKDIAERYPVNNAYITMLAHRVIAGGSGSWGSPVMSPHPQLSHEDTKIMVSYILSLKER